MDKIIRVKIDKPDYLGEFNIYFRNKVGLSEHIALPRNCSLWTNNNEGNDRLKIVFQPSEETLTYLYDQDLEIKMNWSIVEVVIKDDLNLSTNATLISANNTGRLLQEATPTGNTASKMASNGSVSGGKETAGIIETA